MISGQAPNAQTQADCQTFSNMLPGTIGSGGQALGFGCVYPAAVPTVASQLDQAGFTWRSYNESMGSDPARETPVCAHPAVGGSDNTQSATASDEYATRHNPFVYFHGIIDNTTLCNSHVVGLDPLAGDLGSVSSTPNYSFITPDLCNDGHDAPCKNGQPGGLVSANAFLQTWVPKITASPAYRQDGLLMVLFDEAAGQQPNSCCGEIAGPAARPRDQRPRRRADRRGAALALHRARHGDHDAVQPLLDAGQRRGPLRPLPSRLRGGPGRDRVRIRHL